ncbi:winged helix-turn-helix domain-containing protein [Shimia biformata]|uniref:winged helix-turn-helix domain-containing protein n=1 Tax=Shimia biformata TaxID=1294299 RepID=UPI00194F025E|nr:winged helix-turn-helix domain-containing protein [Shimia biformata]
MVHENELTRPVLEVLNESLLGELTTTEIRRAVKERVALSVEDLAPLQNRSDQKIDQVIRNLKCHRKTPGNPFCEGFIEDVPRGFRITERGRAYLKRN